MPAGRPTDYEPKHARLAQELVSLGLTELQVADRFGICSATFKTWKKVHPEFLAAVKYAKDDADNGVVRSLYERALGYSHKAVKIFQHEGQTIEHEYIEHYPPDPTSCIFWLKNRRPDQWREKTEVSISLVAGIPNNTLEALKKLAVSQVIEVEEVAQVEDSKE